MTRKLILRFDSPDLSHCEWLVLDETNSLIEGPTYGSLQTLPQHVLELAAWVIVPSENIFFTQIKLPQLKAYQLAKAIPHMLEEQVIDDIENLYFAIGNTQPDGHVDVIVIAKSLIHAWLTKLQRYLPNLVVMLPDMLTVPAHEGQWTVVEVEKKVLVRLHTGQGYAVDKQNLTHLLAKTMEKVKPTAIHYYGRHSEAIMELALPQVPIISHEAINLALVSKILLQESIINLLQGPYQPKAKVSETKRLWQISGILLIIWLSIGFLGNLLQLWQLNSRLHILNQQIAQIYQRIFPQAKTVIAPRLRVEQVLRQLEQQTANNNELFKLLASTGSALYAQKLQLQAFDYKPNRLTIRFLANDFKQLEQIAIVLQQQGLKVTQDNATTLGDKVQAQLVVSL